MDEKQELAWLEAQKIVISVDLVAAAKKQLQFLAAVDKNRCLYEGPLLSKAIYRYKSCWLPLLAKHTESMVLEGPLVVPLDCEWIWHCHRLNPVQYRKDCEKFYGRILDNAGVVSVLQGTSKERTVEIWSSLYPEEPYELNLTIPLPEETIEKFSEDANDIKYDLISAVKRQSSFVYQVSRPCMQDDRFLEGALARYKGFLYLIKRNLERFMNRFCVPTYDIDLIWHSHQLNPGSYCKDLVAAIGKVLEHDDTDSDRSSGKKLNVGFEATTKQWEVTFGSRYWKAGAMYRGNAPSPLTLSPRPATFVGKNIMPRSEHQELQLTQKKVVEVLLEIVGVRNLPVGHKGSLVVSVCKSQPDLLFKAERRLTVFSESGEKHVAAFRCEPAGELLFRLKSHMPSNLSISRKAKTLGTTSISLQELSGPDSKLSIQKWFELVPNLGTTDSMPICLHIAASFTVPVVAPHVLHMVRSHPLSVNTCFLPIPGRVQQLRGWTCVVDDTGKEIISMQMRNSKEAKTGIAKREVVGVIGWSGETRILAEFMETQWALLDSNWSLQLDKRSEEDGHILKLRGNHLVKLFPGRKLEFERGCCNKERNERDFMTLVRFSRDYPYGKALAMFNLKSGYIMVNEEWLALPGIVLAFILSDMLRKEGYGAFIISGESVEVLADLDEEVNGCNAEGKAFNVVTSAGEVVEAESSIFTGSGSESAKSVKSSRCASGSSCCECIGVSATAKVVNGSACGHCEGGGECVDIGSTKCGGCGGGCSGGCGGGCGGSCGYGIKSSDRSGGCGSGCGGCGSGCGGLGNDVKSAPFAAGSEGCSLVGGVEEVAVAA
ncbi:glycine-rich domain-containing protein 1 [Cinnamomum micranthum f. kanehirae]|uniref:Glycine-rich domain-containing protein 1 n=1 Tax=Cinnamomum micranthum f. kanehirae TaxID=337451 RepID=A0A443NH80_9MAGN|nr:glycine-rich domain-containing protein 1 [Cinnamomum micranthum f. kanehirae]